ncbi:MULTISPECIES: UDP-N-acetylmuramate dehydrogenase [Thiorhodovibrio]|uniref:UDP-N-acetylmuramate dehydrogenase n=1 Tax=Thiorhodovibrio TaxID=61593 RepID=UPI0019147ACC|nr:MULTISPECIES: UDP-N-acetylmuramate dehydrogenase [Thiorhodovibrio]MBK5970763.1 UDP-N-acetylenolpyruvoylglucosamine reductase [Thiorhodovibrio winogradskyi]WPL10848.1 UDP-N-acetylenolpyruvoylglucosamine reductase [Thiorhodovibrio litoralis]
MSNQTDRRDSGTTVSAAAIRDLKRICPGAVARDVSLASISRWRIGGTADVIVRPRNIDQLSRLRAWLHAQGLAQVVIGATTNLLFADEGLRAICIQVGEAFASLRVDGSKITAGAGVWVPQLARRAMEAGLAGIEHTCGIPGTLGGLICMNGGSQRKAIASNILYVFTVDEKGHSYTHRPDDLAFSYRASIFQESTETIVQAVLGLERTDDKRKIRRDMIETLKLRREKFPRKIPNCGSVFVSNPEMYREHGPPGVVIERLGLKGYTRGGAHISSRHANFILNQGAAKARDVLELISIVRARAKSDMGINLNTEVRYVHPAGTILSAHVACI